MPSKSKKTKKSVKLNRKGPKIQLSQEAPRDDGMCSSISSCFSKKKPSSQQTSRSLKSSGAAVRSGKLSSQKPTDMKLESKTLKTTAAAGGVLTFSPLPSKENARHTNKATMDKVHGLSRGVVRRNPNTVNKTGKSKKKKTPPSGLRSTQPQAASTQHQKKKGSQSAELKISAKTKK